MDVTTRATVSSMGFGGGVAHGVRRPVIRHCSVLNCRLRHLLHPVCLLERIPRTSLKAHALLIGISQFTSMVVLLSSCLRIQSAGICYFVKPANTSWGMSNSMKPLDVICCGGIGISTNTTLLNIQVIFPSNTLLLFGIPLIAI